MFRRNFLVLLYGFFLIYFIIIAYTCDFGFFVRFVVLFVFGLSIELNESRRIRLEYNFLIAPPPTYN
jgi:hypothetical protein